MAIAYQPNYPLTKEAVFIHGREQGFITFRNEVINEAEINSAHELVTMDLAKRIAGSPSLLPGKLVMEFISNSDALRHRAAGDLLLLAKFVGIFIQLNVTNRFEGFSKANEKAAAVLSNSFEALKSFVAQIKEAVPGVSAEYANFISTAIGEVLHLAKKRGSESGAILAKMETFTRELFAQ